MRLGATRACVLEAVTHLHALDGAYVRFISTSPIWKYGVIFTLKYTRINHYPTFSDI